MIQIKPKVVQVLRGCKSFGFRTNNSVKQSTHLKWRSVGEQSDQNLVIAEVVAMLQVFSNLPCDLLINVGAKSGESIINGVAEPFEQKSMDKVSTVIQGVTAKCYRFVGQYPRSEFLVTYSQVVTVIRVDR